MSVVGSWGIVDRLLPVHAVVFSPAADGTFAVTSLGSVDVHRSLPPLSKAGSRVPKEKALLWSRLVDAKDGDLPPVWHAAFSPDGSLLVAVGEKMATLFNVADGTRLAEMPGSWGRGRVAFSPAGDSFAIAEARDDEDSDVHVFSIEGKLQRTLKGNMDGVSAITWTTVGLTHMLVTGNGYHGYIWDPVQGTLITNRQHPLVCLSPGPDPKYIIGAAEGGLMLFDRATMQLVHVMAGEEGADMTTCGDVAFSPCGNFVAAASETEGKAYIFRIATDATGGATGALVATLESPSAAKGTLGRLAFDPRGDTLLTANFGYGPYGSGAVLRWDISALTGSTV